MRPQGAGTPAAGAGEGVVDIATDVVHPAAAGTAHLQQLAVHVAQPAAAGPLVQVVDILRHQQEVTRPGRFQFRQRAVGGVGRDGRVLQLAAALVVEALHQRRVAGKGLRRRHVLDAVVLPEAIGGAEGADAALGGDAGAGEYHEVAGHGVQPAGFCRRASRLEVSQRPPPMA